MEDSANISGFSLEKGRPVEPATDGPRGPAAGAGSVLGQKPRPVERGFQAWGCPETARGRPGARLLALVALWGLVFLQFLADPDGIVEWWFD